jgi:hypothetical protein
LETTKKQDHFLAAGSFNMFAGLHWQTALHHYNKRPQQAVIPYYNW